MTVLPNDSLSFTPPIMDSSSIGAEENRGDAEETDILGIP
ncbi:hypothetical protein LINGRAHAP2_LOCUS31502 [Linum grandiflorum]